MCALDAKKRQKIVCQSFGYVGRHVSSKVLEEPFWLIDLFAACMLRI